MRVGPLVVLAALLASGCAGPAARLDLNAAHWGAALGSCTGAYVAGEVCQTVAVGVQDHGGKPTDIGLARWSGVTVGGSDLPAAAKDGPNVTTPGKLVVVHLKFASGDTIVRVRLAAPGRVAGDVHVRGSEGPIPTAYPDYEGTWSSVAGSFELLRTTTKVQVWSNDSWVPVAQRCTRPAPSYHWDAGNRTLYLARSSAIHPSEPGPLTAIWLQDQVYGPDCDYGGFFGVNEDPMTRHLPLLPSRDTYNGTFLFLNVTLHRVRDAPPSHEVDVDGTVVAAGQDGDAVREVQRSDGHRYRANVHVDALEVLPYSAVHRN